MRFEPFTEAALADPYGQYATLRAADPVHWSEKLRAWVLFRYDDVAAVLRDDARFSADRRRAAGRGGGAAAAGPTDAPRAVSPDPPASTAVRALMNAALVPRVRAFGPRVDAIVDELVDEVARRLDAGDTVDLVADFAYPLPIRVIAEL